MKRGATWGSAGVLAIALAATGGLPGTAQAGTVYRCESADGGLSYVSKRLPGAKCKAVSSYRSTSAPAPKVPDWVAPAAGAATTTANAAGSPASLDANPPAAIVSSDVPKPATSGANTTRLVQGQVYSYIKDGVRHYTSKPPKGGGATALRTIQYRFLETCYACGANPGLNFKTLRLNTTAYQNEVKAAAAEFGVEEAVIRAIMHAESAFKPNALSRVGAQGLMQLMPATARRFGVSNAFDPQQNIRGGTKYLSWLLKRFNGNLTLAAAGYNAGEGAVDKYKGVPPYSETRRYVERVAVLADRYRGQVAAN
ncbi:lytic transglycosylase domain-containing protein [Luteimonas vadosa]|uniref:Lytic transglycosylase domain-containing protein n=1 Tax=Luteimonas vadosa TaxID=1165507 RepID=A0ABP9DWE9_9GAMM